MIISPEAVIANQRRSNRNETSRNVTRISGSNAPTATSVAKNSSLRSQRGVGSRVLNIAVPEIRVQRRPQPPLWSLYGVRVLRADYKRPWAELREGLSKLNLA